MHAGVFQHKVDEMLEMKGDTEQLLKDSTELINFAKQAISQLENNFNVSSQWVLSSSNSFQSCTKTLLHQHTFLILFFKNAIIYYATIKNKTRTDFGGQNKEKREKLCVCAIWFWKVFLYLFISEGTLFNACNFEAYICINAWKKCCM